jgi:hypothetical protein
MKNENYVFLKANMREVESDSRTEMPRPMSETVTQSLVDTCRRG